MKISIGTILGAFCRSDLWSEHAEVVKVFMTLVGRADSEWVFRGSLKKILFLCGNPLAAPGQTLESEDAKDQYRAAKKDLRVVLGRLIDSGRIAELEPERSWKILDADKLEAAIRGFVVLERCKKKQAAYRRRKKKLEAEAVSSEIGLIENHHCSGLPV